MSLVWIMILQMEFYIRNFKQWSKNEILMQRISVYMEFTVPKLVVDANLKTFFYLMCVNNSKFANIIPELNDNLLFIMGILKVWNSMH